MTGLSLRNGVDNQREATSTGILFNLGENRIWDCKNASCYLDERNTVHYISICYYFVNLFHEPTKCFSVTFEWIIIWYIFDIRKLWVKHKKTIQKNFGVRQVYKYEMRISDNIWCTKAVSAIKIWHCVILLCHQQMPDAQKW